MRIAILVTLIALASGCTAQRSAENGSAEPATAQQPAAASPTGTYSEPQFGTPVEAGTDLAPGEGDYRKALFAGGCFWCMEPPFDKLDGVVATISGYAGGSERDPTYQQIGTGRTGHTEAVLVIYDPARVDYEKLLDVFWRSHDPTDVGGQFVDRGPQYRPAVFVYDAKQRELAMKSRDALDASGRFDTPVKLEITDAPTFWPAEEYHQDFYKKDPSHYKRYRSGSGRDQFLERTWNGN